MHWVVLTAASGGMLAVFGGYMLGFFYGKKAGATEALSYTLNNLGSLAPGFRKRLIRRLMNDANPHTTS